MTTQEYLDLGLPEGMEMNNENGGLEIRRRWFSLVNIFTAVFAVFWCGFLVVWYTMLGSFSSGDNPGGGFLLIFYLFPLIHVAVGVWLLYSSLCGFLNKTLIRADWENLSIRHYPLPWAGNKVIPKQEVKQLYVKRRESRGRGGTSVTYEVRLLTQSGSDIKLLTGLPNEEQARFIEQEVERYLQIENIPVRGEN